MKIIKPSQTSIVPHKISQLQFPLFETSLVVFYFEGKMIGKSRNQYVDFVKHEWKDEKKTNLKYLVYPK